MSTQVRDRSAKHESFIEEQLARAERRVRLIDLSAALLAFVAGSLAYAVVVMLLDRLFALPEAVRQIGMLLYLAAATAYVTLVVARPLRWQVNPHFAARQLESTLESDRNHVINWLDIQGQKLPAVIKNSLGQRAAKDLAGADADRAISGTRMYAAGVAAGVAALLFVVLFFAFGLTQFRSLLGRALLPMGNAAVPTRTQVEILRPGDAVVTIGQPVTVAARVGGRVPRLRDKDAPCLLYRHDPTEPYTQRYLQSDESGEWAATVSPKDVANGFTYKVTAGDAETPEYRVTTQPAPLIDGFHATYHYRPYVARADRVEHESRRLQDLQGTAVTLRVRTNRDVSSNALTFEGEGAPAPLKGDVEGARTIVYRFELTTSCKYRIAYTSGAEKYEDAMAQEIVVIPDQLPHVTITEPEKDVTLPAGGHLVIKGLAEDDIGVAKVELRLSLGGKPLRSRPYLADKLGKAEFGTPKRVEYSHLLELPTLLDADGKKVDVKPGMVIEYRLAASDACDLRKPAQESVSEPAYKITVAGPMKDEKQQQKERDEARKKEQEQQKQQEEKLKQEQQQREKERKGQNPDDKGKPGGDTKDPKDTEPPENPKDKGTKDTATNISKELDDKQKGEGKDAGKDEKDDKGEGKEGEKGDTKEGGKPGNQGGQEGNQGAAEGKAGIDKGEPKASEGKDPPKDGKSGEGKGGEPKDGKDKGDGKPSEAKAQPQDGKAGDGEKKAGEGKAGQKQKDATPPGEAKGGGGEKGGEKKPDPGDKKGQGAGKGKSSEAKAEPEAGEGKPPREKRPDPKEAKPADAKKAAEDLKGNDPGKAARAAKALEEMAQKADDEGTRGEAQKAIDQAKKDGKLNKDGKVPGQEGEPMEEGTGRGKGRPGGEEQAPPAGQAKGDPEEGQGGQGGPRDGAQDTPTVRNDKPDPSRPSQLQLQRFKDQVDKDLLKKMNMSQEQFQRFLRDYAELLKRQPAGDNPEALPPSKGGKGNASGGKTLAPTGPGKDDVRNEDRPMPPPAYRDAYQEFLRRMAQTK